ncbi:hypothetical protein IWQ61_007881 [Dispira simplex]|nr:hypothetical protein IWQ61_007881 [Dispira simplex]
MELPQVGGHCALPGCHQLVPIRRGEDPNVRVDQHIAANCRDPGTSVSTPAYQARCQAPSCKTKVLVLSNCAKCEGEFCLKHRFESDHRCPGPKPRPTSKVLKSRLLNFSKPNSASSIKKPGAIHGRTHDERVSTPSRSRPKPDNDRCCMW